MRLAWLAAVLLTGCVRNFPPPPEPARIVPAVPQPPAPAAPGSGRLLIDSAEQPATVDEMTRQPVTQYGRIVGTRDVATPLCASTPCAVDLLLGPHVLRFSSPVKPEITGRGTVMLDAPLTAYRFAMGRDAPHTGLQGLALLSSAVGVAGAMAGIAMIGVGSQTNPMTGQLDAPGLLPAGVGAAIAGGALLALGIALFVVFHPEHQDGTGVKWPVEPAPPPPPDVGDPGNATQPPL
jgi:hypothetical protein